jgi:hypothetical protein
MGMITVSDLEEISQDDELKRFKDQLVEKKTITYEESLNLRGFYDSLYSPMEPVYCMIYPNTLERPVSVFGVTDDDAKYASATDLVSDDQIPTLAPSFAPGPAPTPKPTGTTVDQILAFELVYAPMSVNDIISNAACMDYYYDSTKPKCPEFTYFEDSIKVYCITETIISFNLFYIRAI